MQFKEAGIKTWMLTGDKGETAKMIGISCGLLSEPEQAGVWLVEIDNNA
jgi:P-type E1-E2 ATPase